MSHQRRLYCLCVGSVASAQAVLPHRKLGRLSARLCRLKAGCVAKAQAYLQAVSCRLIASCDASVQSVRPQRRLHRLSAGYVALAQDALHQYWQCHLSAGCVTTAQAEFLSEGCVATAQAMLTQRMMCSCGFCRVASVQAMTPLCSPCRLRVGCIASAQAVSPRCRMRRIRAGSVTSVQAA